jgi:hypothetical protein
VIPRSILWNHRFILNPFSHDAGFSYGWQVYALPVYFVGGEHGFVLLSAAAFMLLLAAMGSPLARRYGPTTAWVGILVAGFVLCGVARESLTNNDVPLMLVEVAAIRMAIVSPQPAGMALDLAIGLLCGFAVAIKPQGVGTVILLAAWLLLRAGRRAPSAAFAFAGGFAPLALVWPLINLLSYGSPFPQIMLLWPPSTGYLPQMRETMAVLMANFGLWYRLNYLRIFSQGMEGWTLLLLCGSPFLFLRSARRDPAVRLLLGFAFGRALVLTLLSRGDPAIVFHDRYHLASYVAVGVAVIIGAYHAVTARRLPRWALQHYAGAAAVVLATVRLFLSPVQMLSPTGNPGSNRAEPRPSMASSTLTALASLAEPRAAGGIGIGSDWVSEFLPSGAVVATTAIDPYQLGRPFLQILPVSQNRIDLAGPPGDILAALRREGAGYLQLTEYSGLNLWMNPLIGKWLQSARRIPHEPGVERLVWFDYPTDKGAQAIYRISGDAGGDPAAAEPTEPDHAALAREADGTLWVRWRPIQAGEVEVLGVPRDGSASELGGTRASFGRFPLLAHLRDVDAIRLIHSVNGKRSAYIDLPYPALGTPWARF